MLVRDAYDEEFHINPNHVVKAYTTKDEEDYAIELSNSDSTMWLDRESYERIVAWMEKHDE